MTQHTLFFKENRLIRITTEPIPKDPEQRDAYLAHIAQIIGADHWLFSDSPEIPGETFLSSTGEIVRSVPQDKARQRMNTLTMQWEDSRSPEEVLKACLKDLNTKRAELASLPIVVQEILLDADAVAVENLRSKIESIQQRIRIGIPTIKEYLVWRDAHNLNHYWQDIESYLNWLSLFALCLEERNTRLYLKCWELKAACQARYEVDPASIYSFNPNEGWA